MRCRRSGLTASVAGGWFSLLALALPLLAVGCRPPPAGPAPARIGVDVGLKRGGSWTTFNVRPSRVVGPEVSLEMRRGEISGFLNGSAVKLRATPDELTGVAGGRVALDVAQDGATVEISGVWNDDRVHFEVSPETLKGTIAGGIVSLAGTPRPWHCQYVLDKVENDGARSGISICSGMPQQTRLEFPSTVDKWLGRAETVVVLLALLASAPASHGDFF